MRRCCGRQGIERDDAVAKKNRRRTSGDGDSDPAEPGTQSPDDGPDAAEDGEAATGAASPDAQPEASLRPDVTDAGGASAAEAEPGPAEAPDATVPPAPDDMTSTGAATVEATPDAPTPAEEESPAVEPADPATGEADTAGDVESRIAASSDGTAPETGATGADDTPDDHADVEGDTARTDADAPSEGGDDDRAPTDADVPDRDASAPEADAGTPVPPAPWAAAAGAGAASTAGGATADSAGARESRADPAPREVVVKRGGVIPALIGGVLAAVVGFAAARYVVPEGWPFPGVDTPDFRAETRAALDAQDEEIEALRAEIAAAQPDLAPIETRLDALDTGLSDLTARVDDLAASTDDRFAEVDDRLTELEKQPMEGALSEEAIAAYERELQALMDQVSEQRAEISSIADDVLAREAEAQDSARRAGALAALSRVTAALDTGVPYAAALGDLDDTLEQPLPDALAAPAADGVATRSELEDSFAPAARAALAAAREAEAPPDDPADRVGAFLRERLGARSVAPREGADADATLSRAEAALDAGELDRALEEIGALPEPAQAELADWTEAARTRNAAVEAAETLAETLNEE